MVSPTTHSNAGRIVAALLSGPCAGAYVRVPTTIAGLDGQNMAGLEINFDLAMAHAVAVALVLEDRLIEAVKVRQKENLERAEEEAKRTRRPNPTTHCQHGVDWDERCSDCYANPLVPK
jgi:hypothetical protein